MAGLEGERWDVLDQLAGLVDHSLVAREHHVRDDGGAAGIGHGHAMRFRLLRTIQSFALARLVAEGREHATRRRHAAGLHGPGRAGRRRT